MKKETHPIEELEVLNSNLFLILDTIIQMKEDVQWYKGTHFFIIEFDEDSMKPDLIFMRAYEMIDYYAPNIIGFFNYKKHDFIVTGNLTNTMIFKKTEKKQDFEFGLPPIRYSKDGEPILGQFETFAVWSIRYRQGKFKILSFFTYNENDAWFNRIDEEYKDGSYPKIMQ